MLVVIFSANICYVFAKDDKADVIKKNLPKLLGGYGEGNMFYFTFLPGLSGTQHSLRIFVCSPEKDVVIIEIPAKGYFKQVNIEAKQVIEFDLTAELGQCYTKSDKQFPLPDSVYVGSAVHVRSVESRQSVCYALSEYENYSEGFLVAPYQSHGKEYIVASYPDPTNEDTKKYTSYTAIVGSYDRTKVRFTMGGTQSSKTASGMLPGESSNYIINAGDVLLIGAVGAQSDLTGSHIVCSKPVGVISGSYCANVPIATGNCNFLQEMEIPTNLYGLNYLVTPIYDRQKASIIEVFAKEPQTTIYRDGDSIGFIRGIGGFEGTGWLRLRANEGVAKPVVISGDKPINVVQFNTGEQDDNVKTAPFQMQVMPIEAFQYDYVFTISSSTFNNTQQQNYINLVHEKTGGNLNIGLKVANGSGRKELNIDSMIVGVSQDFSKVINGKQWSITTLKLTEDGVYSLTSKKAYMAYSYGWSESGSYGYHLGGFSDMTIRDTIPPDPGMTTCPCGVCGSHQFIVKDMPDDPDSRSNLAVIYMHTDESYNFKFTYTDFMPGDDRETTWSLDPINDEQDAVGIITFTDRAGNDTTVYAWYNPTLPNTNPAKIQFAKMDIGNVVDSIFNLYNKDPLPDTVHYIYMRSDSIGNNKQGFEILDKDGNPFKFPFVLQSNDSIPMIIRFKATKNGTFKDSIGIGNHCRFNYKTYVEAIVGDGIGVDDEIKSNNITIYPNPISDYIEIRLNELYSDNQELNIDIYSVEGIKVMSVVANGNSPFKINVSGLASGVYIIKINDKTSKFVKL